MLEPTSLGPAVLAVVDLPRQLLPIWVLGVAAGLFLFVRGLLAYRLGNRVSGIATSEVRGLAAGEVRVSGRVEAGPTVLVSPLQSARCVYYRARVVEHEGRSQRTVMDESRSVEFRLRDDSGAVHVFARGARWELDARLDAGSDLLGDPPGLSANAGPREEMSAQDRDAQIAALLTVHPDPTDDISLLGRSALGGAATPDAALVGAGERHYTEWRVEPGDVITIVASALPFADVGDGASGEGPDPMTDPEIAADLARAEASGTLRGRAQDAWGNAAIPGFGIGRPTRPPVLDPDATPEAASPPGPGTAAAVSGAVQSIAAPGGATGDGAAADRPSAGGPAGPAAAPDGASGIGPDELVLAPGAGGMAVFAGTPVEAAGTEMGRFWQGMAGAVLVIVCAAILVLQLGIR